MDDTIQAEKWRALESRVRKDVEEYERLTEQYLNALPMSEEEVHECEELGLRREQVSRRVMCALVLALRVHP